MYFYSYYVIRLDKRQYHILKKNTSIQKGLITFKGKEKKKIRINETHTAYTHNFGQEIQES